MARKLTLEEEVDNPPLTDEQLGRMRPAREVMPPEFFDAVKRYQGQRGPGKKPPKTHVTMRLDPDVVLAFQESDAENWREAMASVLSREARRRKRAAAR